MSLFALEAVPLAPPAPAIDPDLADELAAVQLAHDLAAFLNAPVTEVWAVMCGKSYTMLESPAGWSALAHLVAHELGYTAPTYCPLVH